VSLKLVRVALAALILISLATAQKQTQTKTSPELRTSRYFDSIRSQPPEMLAFLREMPKGGDLHNHLAGALNAENLITWAAADGLCVDRSDSKLANPPCDDSCTKGSKPAMSCAYQDQNLYNSLVDAWSMRNWERGHESGHDHFFATFDKFFLAEDSHVGDALDEAAQQAAEDRLQYAELMHTADGAQAIQLSSKLVWNEGFAKMRDQLLQGGMNEVVASARQHLDADETKMRSDLQCGTPQAGPGCDVTLRYLYQVLRGLPREVVFAQMVLGFELAKNDPRFVGLNLVMPEDAYIPMRDFDLHMRMLDYLHSVYPTVHITLHAGELSRPLVPPAAMRSHIRESIELGHAERIGHGVDVMDEDDATSLLHEMATRNILVEVCLTSNDEILGVKGDDHPFMAYRRAGVPVALATDDEGVSRSDLTHEYLRAAQTYNLSYADLMTLARNSLEHSFLPGDSLWRDAKRFTPVAACSTDKPSADLSSGCKKFLDANQRAQMQWNLETKFADFEKKY
jgi:adenosine deaminase